MVLVVMVRILDDSYFLIKLYSSDDVIIFVEFFSTLCSLKMFLLFLELGGRLSTHPSIRSLVTADNSDSSYWTTIGRHSGCDRITHTATQSTVPVPVQLGKSCQTNIQCQRNLATFCDFFDNYIFYKIHLVAFSFLIPYKNRL